MESYHPSARRNKERHQPGQGTGDPNPNLQPSLHACLAPLLTGSIKAQGWYLARARTLSLLMPRVGTEDSPACGRAAESRQSSTPQLPSSHILGTIHNQESQRTSRLGVKGLSWLQGRERKEEMSLCRRDRVKPVRKGLATADMKGKQKTPCIQCVTCARPQQPLGIQLHYAFN